MQQILVVDDEPDVCRALERYLSREGYQVHTAYNGQVMHELLHQNEIDLVVLDIRLPGKDGLTLAREIRQDCDIPIIMLTARSDIIDRVVGLETGADDYLPKPFHPRELLARIRTVLRRVNPVRKPAARTLPSIIHFFDWHLNRDTHQLFSPSGEEVPLSPVEFDLLLVFLNNPNRVLSRDFLLDQTRGRAATPFDRAIDVHISHLRKKLEPNPKNPILFKTIRNAGYIFTPTVS